MGVLHSLPACSADNVATYASPCDNSTAAWLLIPPTSVPLGQLVPSPPLAPGHESARRRPLQQDLLGWGPQFKGTFFLMSPRGDIIIQEFQHGAAGTSTSRSFPRYTCTAPVQG